MNRLMKILAQQSRHLEQDEGNGNGNVGAFTPEQSKALSELIASSVGPMINGAIKAAYDRQDKSFSAKLEDAKLKLKVTEPPKEPKGGEDDAMKALRAQVEELGGKLAEQTKAAQDANAKQSRLEETGALEKELTAAGISGPRLAGAMALLQSARGVIGRDENGGVIFKGVEKIGNEEFPKTYSVKDGVANWIKSDEGKAFIPSTGAGGSGQGGGRAPLPPGASQHDRAMAKASDTLSALLSGEGNINF